MVGELAPADLAQEALGALVSLAVRALGGVAHRVPDLVRTDLAEMEIRRQPRGRGVVDQIAVVFIARQPIIDELLETRLRAALSPGCQAARKPPAQSGLVGSSFQLD